MQCLRIIPETAKCPKCGVEHRWPEWIRNLLRFKDGDIESDDDEEGDEDEEEDDDEEMEEDVASECVLWNDGGLDEGDHESNNRKYAENAATHNQKEGSLSLSEDEDDDLGLSLAERLRRRGVIK